MFNTDKPGGRRLLFILLIIVFTIVVFAVRYILIALGWIDGEEEVKKQNKPPKQIEKPIDPTPNKVDQNEMAVAQSVVKKFMPLYTTKDYKNLDGWLSAMKPYLSDSLYSQWKKDIRFVRPTSEVVRSKFKKLSPMHCISGYEKVSCAVEVEYESFNQKNKATRLFESFEVIISRSEAEWKIEELNIHGSFE